MGARLSVQLTGEGTRELGGMIGADVMHVEGDLLDADSSALRLSVRQTETYRGMASDWKGEPVQIPRRDVLGVQERKLSIGGSAILGAAGAAAMFVLYSAISGKGIFEGSAGARPVGPK